VGEIKMLALSLIVTTLLLLMTRYRVWVYAVFSGASFALVLWSLMEFLRHALPTEWGGLSAFLAMLWLYFVLLGVVSGYQKWLHHKRKPSLL
jgi:predicted PurR-regulated permease PerM